MPTRGARRLVTPRSTTMLPLMAAALCACGHAANPGGDGPSTAAPAAAKGASLSAREGRYLAALRQLTFGGENAEAYFSFDGRQLSLQARKPGQGCDRIYRMPLEGKGDSPAELVPVSSGQGATTCAHFLPDNRIVYASTRLAGPDCPPRPDMSQGYVWALYDSYDIFATASKNPDANSELVRLTDTPGYDAEATVCAKNGAIVFTSTRDGDIELYRMDADGRNVKRLTHTLGYDGGAFFNHDCSKIVWRASRPRAGKEAEDYQRLLAQGLVRPSKLELWIANADGSEAMQLTYLDAASFAPFFHPTEPFIVFSSNHGDPRGREFDLWAIGTDGTHLVRITDTPGFDGFPHFTPDGRTLAFSSNRATAPGASDTNVFLARWTAGWPLEGEVGATAADRIGRDVRWLADPAREGRGAGTKGLVAAGEFLAKQLAALGFEGEGDDGGFTQSFDVPTKVTVLSTTALRIAGKPVPGDQLTAPGYSAVGKVRGQLVFAGYGAVDDALGIDDYRGLTVKDRVVLVRRFSPEGERFSATEVKRRLGDMRKKAWLARERGARALVVVDWPAPPSPAVADWKMPNEAALPRPQPPGAGDDAGIPVLVVGRAALEPLLARLAKGKSVPIELEVALAFEHEPAFNVLGRLRGQGDGGKGPIVLGAHYDHLGYGHHGSLAPDSQAAHVGADDNASGTAAVLEIARALAAKRSELDRDVVVAFFSGEEWGLLGSSHYVRKAGDLIPRAAAMINLDMVGRLRGNRLQILGVETASEWRPIVEAACAAARVTCDANGGGYGPSDQAAFYPAGVPVLHFFTGSHGDYHKPSDTADRINNAGAAAVARVVEQVLLTADDLAVARLSYQKVAEPSPAGDMRSFNASLGTIPDYAGPTDGRKGVLLSGVRPGSAADRGGLQRGDLLVRLGKYELRSVHDLMFALNGSKPGETVTAVVVRGDHELPLTVTFQEAHARR